MSQNYNLYLQDTVTADVDTNIIWDVVQCELPLLKTHIQQILKEISE